MNKNSGELGGKLMLWSGICWILAGVIYLSSEAIAASAYPAYSYATNYISDLGVPYYGVYAGRIQDSQLAEVMNIGGFIINGLLFSLAALLFFLSNRTKSSKILLTLALLHTIGNILIGTIHGGPLEAASGMGTYHFIGALLAIIGGNMVVITAGILFRQLGAPQAYSFICYCLGIVGLISLGLLGASSPGLPDGIYERVAVYTITLWEFMTGILIIVGHRHLRRYGTLVRAFNR
jgi:hypothetical membrane protein